MPRSTKKSSAEPDGEGAEGRQALERRRAPAVIALRVRLTQGRWWCVGASWWVFRDFVDWLVCSTIIENKITELYSSGKYS